MVTTGADFVRGALKELGVLDPIEAGAAELIADGIVVGALMLDSWRTDRLTIRGNTRAVYSLASGIHSYTIGSGGTFNQDYPEAIEFWGVIPDDTQAAAALTEEPRGRPFDYEQYGALRTKRQAGPAPTALYFDRSYTAGLGNVLVWPVPDNAHTDVALYCRVPQITTLVQATDYDLPPGYALAIRLNLAVALAGSYSKQVTTDLPDLKERAKESLGAIRRGNVHVSAGRIRSEFVIGGGRTYDVRAGAFR